MPLNLSSSDLGVALASYSWNIFLKQSEEGCTIRLRTSDYGAVNLKPHENHTVAPNQTQGCFLFSNKYQ